MNTPHKYAKEIIHWANGGEIEFRVTTNVPSNWQGFLGGTITDPDNASPNFNGNNIEWRIKPETLRYRVALKKYDDGKHFIYIVGSEGHAEQVETKSLMFVKWLTEWIEVEI